MSISLYNTLTRKKELFVPENLKLIRLYVCGPTVYDNAHIGNARSVVVYDILYRILNEVYGAENILYVRNITDIDDKIINRAAKLKISLQELTESTIRNFHSHMEYINCLKPSVEPRATEHIREMISIINKLLDSGHAYSLKDGHIYFDVGKANKYTDLSGRKMEDMLDGVRVENNANKKHPQDFVLWKPAEHKDDAGINFNSPYGIGRPGWHIECSAMSHKYLGENFDIHGGGVDLIFPHHTNEIAQSTSAFPDSKFAKFWVHNGFLTVEGEKMSKSLGNFVTIADLIDKKIKGEIIRLFLLSAHYRKPLDYNDKAISDVSKMLDYWYRTLKTVQILPDRLDNLPEEFMSALLDDMNTPLAIRIINDLAKAAHSTNSSEERQKNISTMLKCANFLGLMKETINEWFKARNENDEEIQKLINERILAKKNKKWQRADEIRNILSEQGIRLEDKADGTSSWIKL